MQKKRLANKTEQGSQPTISDDKGLKVKYLYRSMTVGLTELEFEEFDQKNIRYDDDDLKPMVIQAVAEGSRTRSVFLHMSKTFHGAQRYRLMGSCSRGEAYNTIMVRIDVETFISSMAPSQQRWVDLSSNRKQHEFFTKGMDGYGRYVRENFQSLELALKAKEVLLMWRGSVPVECMEVGRIHITSRVCRASLCLLSLLCLLCALCASILPG